MIASGRWNPLESVRISLKRRVEQTPYRLWEILVREILVRERESTAKRLEENNQCNPCLEGTKWRVSSCLSSTHTWDPARKQWGTRWGNRLKKLREGTERRNQLNELSEGTEETGWRNWNEEPRGRNRNKDQKEGTEKEAKQKESINQLPRWLQDPGTVCVTPKDFPLQSGAILRRAPERLPLPRTATRSRDCRNCDD